MPAPNGVSHNQQILRSILCLLAAHLKEEEGESDGFGEGEEGPSGADHGVSLYPGFPEGDREASSKRRADCCCFIRLFCCSYALSPRAQPITGGACGRLLVSVRTRRATAVLMQRAHEVWWATYFATAAAAEDVLGGGGIKQHC